MAAFDELLDDLNEERRRMAAARDAVVGPVMDRWNEAGRPAYIEMSQEEFRVIAALNGSADSPVDGARFMGRRIKIASR